MASAHDDHEDMPDAQVPSAKQVHIDLEEFSANNLSHLLPITISF